MHHVPASAPPVGVLLLGACRTRWRMEPAPGIGKHARPGAKESSETIRERVRWKGAGPLGLLLVFTAGCAPIRHGHADAAHEWLRYLGGQRVEAEAGLATMADDEEANFLLANIALANGEHDRAASLTAELRRRHPEDVELQLLEHLVRLREEHPDESWLDLYGEAWRAPGLTHSSAPCPTAVSALRASPVVFPGRFMNYPG